MDKEVRRFFMYRERERASLQIHRDSLPNPIIDTMVRLYRGGTQKTLSRARQI